jgi:hypothetical protein
MSKTTMFLLIILIAVIGLLLFVEYGKQQNPIITSITKPILSRLTPADSSLTFSTNEQSIRPGQTVTVAVLIHNPNPHPAVTQLELAYDPNAVTIDTITPGTFFTKPMVALQTIDPVAGRISYALRCSNAQNPNADCVNASSSTIATITMNMNSYTTQASTTLSFLPKTVIRTDTGRDLLKKTTDLNLTIIKLLFPVASSSTVASPGAQKPF